jgi:hypothetical protein
MIRQQPGRPGVNPLRAGGNAGGLEQGYQQPQGNQPKGMDLSSYSPGRAQPIQPPSQGTPFQAYNQQQSAPRSAPQFGGDVMFAGGTPYFNGRPGPMPRQQKAAPPRETPAVGAQPQVPFTQSAVGVGGQQFSDPSQAFAQRDALIQRINEARAPMFANAGMYMGGAAPPPPQPLDFNALLGQANEMVAGGWQNPFAAPAQPSFSGLMAPPPEAYYPGGTMNDGYGMGPFPRPRPRPSLTDGQAYPLPAFGYPGFPSQPPMAPPQSQPTPLPSPGPAPGYGTPPERRGGIRTMEIRDADGDGVDDRDQDGPGMPPYPPQGRLTTMPTVGNQSPDRRQSLPPHLRQAPAPGEYQAFDEHYRQWVALQGDRVAKYTPGERQTVYEQFMSGQRPDGGLTEKARRVADTQKTRSDRREQEVSRYAPRLSPAAERFQEKVARRTDPSRRQPLPAQNETWESSRQKSEARAAEYARQLADYDAKKGPRREQKARERAR